MIEWLASLLVLSISLQRMESLAPCATGLSSLQRLIECGRGLGWIALATGTFVNVMRPFFQSLNHTPVYDVLPIVGVATVLVLSELRRAGST